MVLAEVHRSSDSRWYDPTTSRSKEGTPMDIRLRKEDNSFRII
jgi:hypothetical protein